VGASNYVTVNFDKIKVETAKAFLLILDDEEGTEVWIPKSQMADPEDYKEGDQNGSVSVTEFIAREKGLEVSE